MRTNHLTVWNGISALLLKTFADELTPAWCPLFQLSLDTGIIPIMWKKAVVIPVPKKHPAEKNNEFRPVALTSIVIKSLERIVTEKLRENVLHTLDHYQFAYKENRSTEDALNFMTHFILKHLENPVAYVRVIFMVLSSAFNTLLPDIVLFKLKQMKVNPYIIKWYYAFLDNNSKRKLI